MRDPKIIDTLRIAAVPWKNGGGITREISQAKTSNGFTWRLSIADVSAEGAFSSFPGMSRILTVIEGRGLQLQSPSMTHDVPLFAPFSFSGDLDIHSLLSNGAIRDFNVIFDPGQINAEVRVVNGPTHDSIGASEGIVYAIFAIQGASNCNGTILKQGSCALVKNDALRFTVPKKNKALYVQLSNLSAPA
jgi:environmental stress-induced protein Ves|tara:strand:+ start:880 stop:1449 length:570 start_codon:yes stop_codon:yes gene_type:complete